MVKSLDFSPRGDLLVGAGRQLTLWRLASGEPIFEFNESIRSAAFNRDGTKLALARDKSVIVYDRWVGAVCGVAQRNLTCDEWTRYVGAQPYRAVCPALPGPRTCAVSATLPR